jgi:HD superfamily phosphohydrolase
MQRQVRLSLYGNIDYPSPDYDMVWDMFQSAALTRLRDISLSSTPSRFAAHGMAASRFEHSVGVAYLARKLCDRKGRVREDKAILQAAALCHDIGSPPFSHISEIFMFDMLKRTHEEETQRLLSPKSELAQILKAHKVDPERVVEMIKGQDKELGPLIAGSIDLDNIDNSIHLLRSMGYDSDRYKPLDLINAYKWYQGKLYLDTDYLADIVGWSETRKDLYQVLHSDPHLSSATMLYRAIEFAYSAGQIEKSFFKMGESDALFFLANRTGKKTREIMNRTLRWRQYHLYYQRLSQDHDLRLKAIYTDWKARKQLTDEIAERLNIPAIDVSLYVGEDRAEKAIDLPFIGEHSATISSLFSNRVGAQRLAVFMPKEYSRLYQSKKLNKAIEDSINSLPEQVISDDGHSFF